MRKVIIFATYLLIVTISSLALGCAKPPTPFLEHLSRNLVNGTIIVSPSAPQRIPFSVNTPGMRNVRVVGNFEASGGSGNDIVVAINRVTESRRDRIYSSGQVTRANIDVQIRTSGQYELVFSNSFSILSSKSVFTKVDLTWDKLSYLKN